jgi:hypothetical protein
VREEDGKAGERKGRGMKEQHEGVKRDEKAARKKRGMRKRERRE